MILDASNIKDVVIENKSKSLTSAKEVVVENNRFTVPTDIDYFGDDLSPLIASNIGDNIDKSYSNLQLKETYYIETPPSLVLGYNQSLNVFLLKAESIIDNNQAYDLNQYDGDTMSFKLDSIEEDPNGFDLLNKHYDKFIDYVYNRKATKIDETFGLRFLGVNAPELAHYTIQPISVSDIRQIQYIEESGFWNKLITDKSIKRISGEYYDFYKMDGEYHEIVDKEYKTDRTLKDGAICCKIVFKDQSDNKTRTTGKKVQDLLKNLLENAKDMRIMIDMQTIMSQSEYVTQDDMFNDFMHMVNYPLETISELWKTYFEEKIITSYRGFNCFGMDRYRRFLGTIFIKNENDVWINVTKYLIANSDESFEVMPAYSQSSQSLINYTFSPDAFKLWTYNKNGIFVADALHSTNTLDDRNAIQKAIYGKDSLSELTDYTVMIGDSLIMIPPTQIQTSNETSSIRLPIMRGNGSTTKSTSKAVKYLQMELFFSGKDSINGVPVKQKLPSGQDTIYYMNGLRALIAQFKVCPFLPIENKYINEVLNIEAVSLKNINIETVPSQPNCLKATLTLQDFNYRVYMPEIVSPKLRTEEYNMFASTICFPLMRYYYQRMIQKGNFLASADLDIDEEIKETLGEKTALQPYVLDNSDFSLYLLDHDQLAQKLQVKLASQKTIISDQINLTQEMSDFMESYKDNVNIIYNENVDTDIKTLMSNLKTSGLSYSEYQEIALNQSLQPSSIPAYALNASILDPLNEGNKVSTAINKIVNLFNRKLYGNDNAIEVLETTTEKGGICWNFYITPKTDLSVFDIGDSIQYAANSMNNKLNNEDEAMLSTMIKNGIFILQVAYNDKTERIELNHSSIGFKILKTFGTLDLSQTFVEDIKQATDIVTSKSFKWNKIDFNRKNVQITKQLITMKNNYSNMSTQFQDGCAPQFMGGQDMGLQIEITTTDKAFVALLSQIPTIASQYLKRFRKVLNVFPVRISSALSKMFNINEVTIETVNSSTVPGMPGVYNLTLVCVSVDRTQRNRESLKKVNDFYNFGKTAGLEIKNFFDLKPVLANAELYPDLELPTLIELEKAGYKFIRYANNTTTRIYPDPDFYFVYGHKLGHEIFRQSLLKLINKEFLSTMDINVKDGFGGSGSFNIDPDKDVTIKDVVIDKHFSDGLSNAQKAIEEKRHKITDLINDSKFLEDKEFNDFDYNQNFSDVIAYESSDKIAISKKIKSYYNSEIKTDSSMYVEHIKPKVKNIIDMIDKQLSKSINAQYTDAVAGTEIALFPNKIKEHYKNQGLKLEYAFLNSKIDSEMLTPKSSEQEHLKVVKEIGDFITETYFSPDGFMYGIIKELGILDSLESQKDDLINLYVAAAISNSALVPYSKEVNSKWKARYASYFYYEDLNGESKKIGVPLAEINDGDSIRIPNDLQDAIDNGNKLGTFAITKYDANTIYRLTGKSPTTNKKDYFVDPYYTDNLNKEELDLYKRSILLSPYVGALAYTRIMLTHLKDLLNKNLFITVGDLKQSQISRLKQDSNITALGAAFAPLEANVGTDSVEELERKAAIQVQADTKRLTTVVENSKTALGKIFDLLLIAEDDKNYFKKCIISHNYSSYESTFKSSNDVRIKKFKMALVALNLLESQENIGVDPYADKQFTDHMEAFYLDASKNPELYLQHSFYDMIHYDKRGRMLRAFPTYYFLMVDEGREIGRWKIHDNFYNMSAINSIEVLDSRKLAASTCTISLSNMFKTFNEQDEDTKEKYKYDWKDVVSSVYAPYSYALREEVRHQKSLNINRAKLQPGIRVHLRMGYGANAADLPIVFNGNISEVGNGECVNIVAQGDGRELTNPLLSQTDMEDIQNNAKFPINKFFANWMTEGATPKTILSSLLTDTGTYNQNFLNNLSNGLFFNHNPYGIVHFGDNKFNKSNGGIFTRGETVQNIYEANVGPVLGDSDEFTSALASYYTLNSAPKLSAHLYGKSFWDIMHICSGASLDYMTSVIPFGLRSSIFFGKGRYYAAYDYDKILDKFNNEYIIEKRKPFQQYHIITSYSDIIGNNIKSSDKNINTVAIGTYQSETWLNRGKVKQVGPLFVDYDIYPENQKTTLVDTGYLSKGSFAGDFIPFSDWIAEELNVQDKKTGSSDGGRQIAWRMTANALKESIKDMYDGQVLIIGDPSIKPYDRVHITDTYEDLTGMFEVETVVHSMNIQQGFVTSIYPDCIAEVDDRLSKREIFGINALVSKALAPYFTFIALSQLFNYDVKPLLNVSKNMVKTGGKVADSLWNTTSALSSKKVFKRQANIAGFIANSNYGRVSVANSTIINKINDLNAWKKLYELEDMTDAQIYLYTKNLGITSKNLSVDDTIRDLYSFSKKDIRNMDEYEESIFALVDYKENMNKVLSDNPINKMTKKDLDTIFSDLSKFEDELYPKIAQNHNALIKDFNMKNPNKKIEVFSDVMNNIRTFKDVDFTASTKLNEIIVRTDDFFKVYSSSIDEVAKTVSKTDEITKIGTLAFKGTATGAFLSTVSGMIVEEAICFCISKYVDEFFSRKLRNLQVLQIYPLKREGSAYTSGLKGSKGLIVGSASYNDMGIIDTWVSDFFDPNEHSEEFNFIRDIFAGGSRLEQVSNNILQERNPSDIKQINNIVSSLSADEIKTSSRYDQELLLNRFSILNLDESNALTDGKQTIYKEDIARIQNQTSITSIEELNSNSLNEMIPIQETEVMTHKFFQLIHNTSIDTQSIQDISSLMQYKGKQVQVNGIAVQQNNMTFTDYPILNKTAYSVLEEFLNRYNIVAFKEKRLDKKITSLFKGLSSKIILTSGLRISKESTWNGTGTIFSFKTYQLKDSIQVLDDMLKDNVEINNKIGRKVNLFSYEVSDKGKNSGIIKVSVNPIDNI